MKRTLNALWLALPFLIGCEASKMASGIEGSGKHLTGSASSVYWDMAGRVEDDAMRMAGYSYQFKQQNKRWPGSFKELKRYVKDKNGEDLWPRRLDDLKFNSKEDGGLVIIGDYIGPGYEDSTSGVGHTPRDKAMIVISAEGDVKLIVDPDDVAAFK